MWASQKKKKEKQKYFKYLNTQFKELHGYTRKHGRRSDQTILKKIKEVKSEINQIYDEQEQFKLKCIKQRFYENCPKAKKLMAWRIKKPQAERSIFKIRESYVINWKKYNRILKGTMRNYTHTHTQKKDWIWIGLDWNG